MERCQADGRSGTTRTELSALLAELESARIEHTELRRACAVMQEALKAQRRPTTQRAAE
jgi:hypothetical protein